MKMSVAVVVAWLVGASSAVAQVAPVVPDPDPAKPQVQTFEMLLRSAVETGGQNFARRAAQITPDIAELSFSTGEAPVVSGIADHQLGLYVFQVQVPSVSLLSLQVMNLMMNRPALGRPVGRVAATNVPDGPPAAVALPDFVGMYRIAVRDALIDAIVDNAGGLPIGASDTLLVYASGIEPPMQPSLLRQPSNKLVLKATGADVLEYRHGKITRDEIRRRIRVASF
jgi:hypothetical protein